MFCCHSNVVVTGVVIDTNVRFCKEETGGNLDGYSMQLSVESKNLMSVLTLNSVWSINA
jgi:hypothetical protein